MDINVCVKRCLSPVQCHELVLDCLGTKVISSNSLKDWQEEYTVSFHYIEGIFHQEDVSTLYLVWMCPQTEIQLYTSNSYMVTFQQIDAQAPID